MSETRKREFPIWLCLWLFCRQFFSCWWGTARMYTRWCSVWSGKPGAAKARAPWYVVAVNAFVLAPTFAWEQAYAGWLYHELGFPAWGFTWATRVHDPVGEWVEKRATWWTWLRADSGDPTEISFHCLSTLLKRDPETGEYIDRPRIWVRQL